MNKYILKNGNVILMDRILHNAGIIIEGTLISDIFTMEKYEELDKAGFSEIDVDGQYISPGFIDIHVHGGANSDFMDGNQAAIRDIINLHARHGTTSLVATTLTSTLEDLIYVLDNIQLAVESNYEGARILGAHLEGPYFSLKQKGAQNPQYLKNPERKEYLGLLERYPELIKRVSAAPELDGSLQLGRDFSNEGILVSMAHTDATYDEAVEAVAYGFSHITHMYNSTSTIKSPDFYCQAGVVEAGLGLDELSVEVIADGRHIPIGILRMLYKVKGPDRLALVTDASRAAGMPPGRYQLGGLDIVVEDNVGMLVDRTSFAGSVATTDRLARVIHKEAGISLLDTVKMLTLTPANLIDESQRKGSITPGKDADIIVFDENINISLVLREGTHIK